MNRLQEAFAENGGPVFTLTPGEYEGPLRVDRPCTLDGCGATLWADGGPVLVIEAAGVTVKNLRVEVTGTETGSRGTALLLRHPDTVLEQVEVRGDVTGLPGESPHWDLPPLLSLGDFAAETENSFSLTLTAPAEAELLCGLGGVSLNPARLAAGTRTVLLQVDALRDRTVLYGDLFVKTRVLRRICVTGRAMKDAPRRRETAPAPAEAEGPVPVPAELIAPASEGECVPYVKRGQRVPFQERGQKLLKAALEFQSLRQPLDLDAYVFLLQGNGRVRGDADFVFFGNSVSPDGAVRLAEGGRVSLVLAELEKLDPAVERLAICYSIYEGGEGASPTFAQVQEPLLRIFAGEEEVFRLKLEDLRVEKTLVAVEVYRYKGQWKLNFVGAGYRDGLRRLCESYGVEVE